MMAHGGPGRGSPTGRRGHRPPAVSDGGGFAATDTCRLGTGRDRDAVAPTAAPPRAGVERGRAAHLGVVSAVGLVLLAVDPGPQVEVLHLARGRPVEARRVAAVAVPVAQHQLVAGSAEPDVLALARPLDREDHALAPAGR